MTKLDRQLVKRAALAAAVLVCMTAISHARAQGVADTAEPTRPEVGADAAQPSRTQDGGAAASSSDAAQSTAPGRTAAVGNLLWQIGSNGAYVPWNEAQAYCETLEHAGFDDWRLPTIAELETIHDPSAEGGLRAPLELGDCCAWSSTNLVEEPAQAKGALPDPTNAPRDYYWGFLFGSGDRYYSFRSFPDGLAMCVREP